MRIPIYRTITEALGFAWHRYDTILRLAWFPLLVISAYSIGAAYFYATLATGRDISGALPTQVINFLPEATQQVAESDPLIVLGIELVRFFLVAALYTAFLVPLLRFAARDVEPHHRSITVSLGGRQLKFLLALVLSVMGLGLITFLPVTLSTMQIENHIAMANANPYAVFPDPESIHTIEEVARIENMLPYDIAMMAIGVFFWVGIIYVSLRTFAAPIAAAVREKTDSYGSLGVAMQISRGWNTLRLGIIVVILAACIFVISTVVNGFALPLILSVLNSVYNLLTSITDLTADFGEEPRSYLLHINWFWLGIKVLIQFAVTTFMAGLVAGLGGSLFRRWEAEQ